MMFKKEKLKSNRVIVPAILVTVFCVMAVGCTGMMRKPVEGSTARVAKVDTEYIYEANVAQYVGDYKESRRNRITNFIGFSPNEILSVREQAIDTEIRKEIRRLPGVTIDTREVDERADELVQDLAYDLYDRIMAGEDMAALSRDYSTTTLARASGYVDPFGELEDPKDYQVRAYEMEPGEISEPFYSWDGWRIIRLDEIEDDPLSGKLYYISMIHLAPDPTEAEAAILDEAAEDHTIEILDPKYNSRTALDAGNFDLALSMAEEALDRSDDDDLAHYLKARALWGLDRHDESLESMARAADTARVSDGLAPYYNYYTGEYLEALDRMGEANDAYIAAYDGWQQDINMAIMLRAKFEQLENDEYLEIIQGEIDDIIAQEEIVLTFMPRGSGGGVITTNQGRSESGSLEYEEGYRE